MNAFRLRKKLFPLDAYLGNVHKWCPTFFVFFDPPSPPNPILSNFSTWPYYMMSDLDPQTPPPLLHPKVYRRFPKLANSFKYLAEKLQNIQNPGIIPSFYGHLTIVSLSHDPQKKIFFWPEKNFFWPQFFFFFFLNFFFSKSHRNYGDIMPGFGTWSKSIIFMVITFAVY